MSTPDPGPAHGWLHISAEGVVAGATAAALTYTLVSWCSGVTATGTGALVDAGGSVAAAATRYFFGEIPAMTVRILGRVGSSSSEASIQRGGEVAAALTSAAVGGTTALTVSIGSRLIKATIEYGGALTKEAARRITETYLTYKVGQAEEATDAVWKEEEGDWTLLETDAPSRICE